MFISNESECFTTMKDIYRSPYEAYPFLADDADDLRCDYELHTDRLSSEIGLLRAKCASSPFYEELEKIGELVYHANACVRTKMTITQEEIDWLKSRVDELNAERTNQSGPFFLPQGSERGALAHILRVDCKVIVRLLYRHLYQGKKVDSGLLDFFNLLSGYFFMIAMKFNREDDVAEIPFVSRNYR
ncbi:ATP--cob(I)alamin adenosyltransferase [Enterococcus mundtii]|nr:ATP--cob(I)alamin adenosyltransferase [Enterococcus mundtii]PTO40782.1 ATP--cob(I)alamin adenosyltransferase [Enterococcus mundtii]